MKKTTSKKTYCFLIFLLFFLTKLSAQFGGYYNLHDGGVDMPHSSLFILNNNTFYIFYYGGYKTGNWKEVNKNNIILTETKIDSLPFSLYGKFNNSLTGISLNVYGLVKSHAFINFSKDTFNKKELQPIFNEQPNCIGHNYQIKKMKGEFKWITITSPAAAESRSYGTRYPYKALGYTFQLNNKYNDYTVIYNENALVNNMDFTLTKDKEIYSINGGKELEREILTDKILKEIYTAKKNIDQENFYGNSGDLIRTVSSEKINIYKPVLKPIFIVKCETEKIETENQESNSNLLPRADRPNGFYSVVDFKEKEYDIEKYQLAKEPSITSADILSINKIISDEGGYEIEIEFTEKGRLKFKTFSQNNIRKPIAIVINKFIIDVPIFVSAVPSGKIYINGDFSEIELDNLILSFKN